ncbi:MAG: heavy metal translocating P-type ATPase [Clostridia bacterium]|nr:heavy metal translocating P-type ATPase [Clostridia bacterium]
MKEMYFRVNGMTCSACSARVERAAASVAGVNGAAVSLLTGGLTVQGDFDEKELMEAVTRAGYGILPEAEAPKTEEKKERGLKLPFILSLVILAVLMCFSMGPMLGLSFMRAIPPLVNGICQWLLSTAVLILHRRFFIGGFRALFHGGANMDTLVAMGSGVSYLYSLVCLCLMPFKPAEEMHELLHDFYFESAAMILVFITIGKMLEAHAKGKSTSALKGLEALAPATARVVREGEELTVPADALRIDDLCAVYAGERFPADGTVTEGEGAADESALTGESVPVDKAAGETVYAGTVSLTGKLLFRVTKPKNETALSRIIDAVTRSAASKAPISRLGDRVSRIFVPTVMGIALLTALVHLLLDAPLAVAVTRGVTVLVVSCPCALGLATPVSILVGTTYAAERGVLFKSATALEEVGRARTVAFDKTGTLTTGKMKVSSLCPAEGREETELFRLAAALEEKSLHPIALAITEEARARGIEFPEAEDHVTRAGFGITARFEGKPAAGGKRALLEEFCPLPPALTDKGESLAAEGRTVVYFALDGEAVGLIALQDHAKEDAAEAVAELKDMGVQVIMISGDSPAAARAVAEPLGIDRVHAGVLPEEKAALLDGYRAEGGVCMVGDGINDAPALTAATVGIAVGGGVDIAVDAAEVVVMTESLVSVPRLMALSRATLRNIKQNLFWALCYNIVGIPLAAGVFTPLLGWSLSPMFGAAAMSLSSFVVVTNALRLSFHSWEIKKNKKKVKEKTMEKIISVTGMMCPHCEAHVKKALEALPQVKEATPSHQTGKVQILLNEEVEDRVLFEVIEKEGYKIG